MFVLDADECVVQMYRLTIRATGEAVAGILLQAMAERLAQGEAALA